MKYRVKDFAVTVLATLVLANSQIAISLDNEVTDTLRDIDFSGRVNFIEKTKSALFVEPDVQRGVFRYDKMTGVFEKETTEPDAMLMTVSESELSVTQGGKTRHFSLTRATVPARIFAAFRALVTRDLALLEQEFDVQFERQTKDKWQLTLVPLEEKLRLEVAAIVIDGVKTRISRVFTHFSNGDWQHLAFESDSE